MLLEHHWLALGAHLFPVEIYFGSVYVDTLAKSTSVPGRAPSRLQCLRQAACELTLYVVVQNRLCAALLSSWF